MQKVKSFSIKFRSIDPAGVDYTDSAFLKEFLLNDVTKQQNQWMADVENVEFLKENEIPQKAPTWCKPDEWCYNLILKKYARIEKVYGLMVSIVPLDNSGSISSFCADLVYARVVPFLDFASAPSELRVQCKKKPFTTIVRLSHFSCTNELVWSFPSLKGDQEIDYMTSETLLEDYVQINGKPCGILQHMEENKKGEVGWVE